MATTEAYQEIPITDLHETQRDPRLVKVKGAKIDIDSLVSSIKTLGVLQPLVVRTNDTGFEILAGRRRFRAAKKAKLETVPCIVRDCDDDEAHSVTLTENLQRLDLHPLQAAQGFATLADAGKSVEDMAAETGYSVSVVQRRLQLRSLTTAVKKAYLDPKHPASRWTLRTLELVASYPEGAQNSVVAGTWNFPVMLQDVQRRLATYERSLDSVPWELEDETLVPEAGACSTCPLRTGCSKSLFEDLAVDGDRCLNAECFKNKQDAYLVRSVELGREKHPEVHLISESWKVDADRFPAFGQEVLASKSWQRSKKRTKGSEPAFLVDGPNRGQLIWVELPTAKTVGKGSGDSIEAKIERGEKALRVKRLRQAVPALLAAASGQPTPEADVLLRLVSVFGGVDDQGTRDFYRFELPKSLDLKEVDSLAWSLIEQAPDDEALFEMTWRDVQGVIESRLNLKSSFKDLDVVEAEARSYARLVGLEWETFWTEAKEACPAPKALVKRREMMVTVA